MDFFKKVKLHCAEEFTTYWKCIDKSGHDMNYKRCRQTQGVFDKCIFDHLGQERPELGYFSKVRVHHTKRPEPEKKVILPEEVPVEHPKWHPADPFPPNVGTGGGTPFMI